ncbi:MAG: 2Fe-2S iron-sulfur cluster binding domain-containing protein [Burkholderiales bacterium]|nr:2Fe-2S iron-sulfur cluster binding domain-containing protein [Burkholderiales bacterium]
MTAAQLLAYIAVALLVQVIAGVAFAVWRRPSTAGAPAPAGIEDVVAAPGPSSGAWSGWREFRVVRREFEDAARTQCSFHLQPVDGRPLAPYQPGQYLTFSLKLPGGAAAASVAERSITRCYSLSDRPDPTGYRITIKRVAPPADQPELPPGVSSGYFHDRVHEGHVLRVKAPSGHFYIDPDANVPAVFIAGGIGITPMMSMLLWCAGEQPERLVHLYYGVRSSEDHAFKRVLEDLAAAHPAFKLNVVYSRPGADDLVERDYQYVGYIDLALLRRTLPHGRHQFYICGPPAMMQSLVPALREWGVPADDIRFEAFGPASVRPTGPVSNEPVVATSACVDVRFSRSGRTLTWDGQDGNLLDFAERHGLDLDSGCRSGSCGACQTRLASGVVTYVERPDHDIPKGHCLLCVGKPQSALVLEA